MGSASCSFRVSRYTRSAMPTSLRDLWNGFEMRARCYRENGTLSSYQLSPSIHWNSLLQRRPPWIRAWEHFHFVSHTSWINPKHQLVICIFYCCIWHFLLSRSPFSPCGCVCSQTIPECFLKWMPYTWLPAPQVVCHFEGRNWASRWKLWSMPCLATGISGMSQTKRSGMSESFIQSQSDRL